MGYQGFMQNQGQQESEEPDVEQIVVLYRAFFRSADKKFQADAERLADMGYKVHSVTNVIDFSFFFLIFLIHVSHLTVVYRA